MSFQHAEPSTRTMSAPDAGSYPVAARRPAGVRGRLAELERQPGRVRVASLLLIVVAWEYFGRQVNPIFLSYPSSIVVAFGAALQSGELLRALATSLVSLSLGFFAAMVLGIPAGLLMGRYRLVEYLFDLQLNALYATPLIALVPLIVLWVGLGVEAKVLIVFLTAIFPIVINIMTGVRNVRPALLEVARAFCASERQVFLKIILPSTVPYIVAGLRLGIGRAVVGMVVAEFFTAISGLGYMIIKYGNLFRTDLMFVPIVVLMALGVGLTAALRAVERKVAPWSS